jgi:hypothetical protein
MAQEDTRRRILEAGAALLMERGGLASGERAARLIRVMFAMTGFEFFEALSQDDTPQGSVASELKQLLRQCIRSL